MESKVQRTLRKIKSKFTEQEYKKCPGKFYGTVKIKKIYNSKRIHRRFTYKINSMQHQRSNLPSSKLPFKIVSTIKRIRIHY